MKARLHNYIALKECRGLDLLTSICYTRRESELYKECASHLEKVHMNFSDIINMCNVDFVVLFDVVFPHLLSIAGIQPAGPILLSKSRYFYK